MFDHEVGGESHVVVGSPVSVEYSKNPITPVISDGDGVYYGSSY